MLRNACKAGVRTSKYSVVLFNIGNRQKDKMKIWCMIKSVCKQEKFILNYLQVGFLKNICLPCYELLHHLIPETEPLLAMCQDNLRRWEQIQEEVKQVLEKNEASSTSNEALPNHLYIQVQNLKWTPHSIYILAFILRISPLWLFFLWRCYIEIFYVTLRPSNNLISWDILAFFSLISTFHISLK